MIKIDNKRKKLDKIIYWITTIILSTECIFGGIWGGLQLPPFSKIISHLGYPAYFMSILAAFYFLAGIAILLPRFPRLKEWAYAGLIFNFTGAVASHIAVGDSVIMLIGPFFFIVLAVLSWKLRLSDRQLNQKYLTLN